MPNHRYDGNSFILIIGMLLTFCFTLVFVVPSAVNAQAERTLRVAHMFPAFHYTESVWMEDFKNLVEEKSNGRLAIESYPGGELVGPGEALEATQGGIADIALLLSALNVEEFPSATVTDLPLIVGPEHTSVSYGQAAWRLLHEPGQLRSEWEGQDAIPIAFFIPEPVALFTRDQKVETVEDLQGLKIRVSGGLRASTIEALGATPVVMPPPESVVALERGTVDGTMLFWNSAHGQGVPDVANYATAGVAGLYAGGVTVWEMDRSNFESLPSELQRALLEAGYESSINLQRYLHDVEQDLIEQYREGDKLTVTNFPQEEDLSEIREMVSPVYDEFLSMAQDRGFDGEALIDQYQEALQESLEDPDDWPRYYEQYL